MENHRLAKWKKSEKILTLLTDGEEDRVKNLLNLRENYKGASGLLGQSMTINAIIAACKELIFDVVDGKAVFHAIMYTINAKSIDIRIEHMMNILPQSGDSKEENDRDIIDTLAYAAIEEIPVLPNRNEAVAVLTMYHKRMLTEGFTAPDGEGGRTRLKLTRPTQELLDFKKIETINRKIPYSPADLGVVMETMREELARRDHAGRILATLTLAISEMSDLLKTESRIENKLQACLTRNPILFGTEYVRVLPKHRLGSEYEMDYALERANGLFDLVEIESSSLKLYTKSNDPTAKLTHAEQQVFDWLSWVERYNGYARKKLPNLMQPVGFVVIGRRRDLNEMTKEKLLQRNAILRGSLQILTYDDLLDRARKLQSLLNGLGDSKIK